jgi:hypothetical protein
MAAPTPFACAQAIADRVFVLIEAGRLDEADRDIGRALDLDPAATDVIAALDEMGSVVIETVFDDPDVTVDSRELFGGGAVQVRKVIAQIHDAIGVFDASTGGQHVVRRTTVLGDIESLGLPDLGHVAYRPVDHFRTDIQPGRSHVRIRSRTRLNDVTGGRRIGADVLAGADLALDDQAREGRADLGVAQRLGGQRPARLGRRHRPLAALALRVRAIVVGLDVGALRAGPDGEAENRKSQGGDGNGQEFPAHKKAPNVERLCRTHEERNGRVQASVRCQHAATIAGEPAAVESGNLAAGLGRGFPVGGMRFDRTFRSALAHKSALCNSWSSVFSSSNARLPFFSPRPWHS